MDVSLWAEGHSDGDRVGFGGHHYTLSDEEPQGSLWRECFEEDVRAVTVWCDPDVGGGLMGWGVGWGARVRFDPRVRGTVSSGLGAAMFCPSPRRVCALPLAE
jgi:hypothetical protein